MEPRSTALRCLPSVERDEREVPGGSPFALPVRMTNSAKDHPPYTKSHAATEPPLAQHTQPALTVPHTTLEADLESRVNLRRAELIAKLGELRGDARFAIAETRDLLKAKLSELAHIIKIGVVDGWASLGDTVKHDLERWLAESRRSIAAQDPPTQQRQS